MTLTDQIVRRQPLDSAGNSGNLIERVTMRDGRSLVLKRVSPDWDWMSRVSGDRGRLVSLWETGFFHRLPPAIDHATIAVEAAGSVWNVFMRDVSSALVAPDERVSADDVQRVLSAMHALHDTFWDERFPDLCSLEDRYTMFSPRIAGHERQLGNPHGEAISRGWEAFPDLVSNDVATAILGVADRPQVLATQLAKFDHTLIHGDVRLGNLGFDGERIVLIDWGERVGSAPPAVELAWFIGFDAYRLEAPPDDVVATFSVLYGTRSSDTALHLALIGGLVQLGGIMSLWVVSAPDEARRRLYRSHLSWWDTTVARALDACSLA